MLVTRGWDAGGRLWGVAAQLYLLRSKANWGIGDFSDLRKLVLLVGDRGADVVGLNPLHAMFLDNPEQASPYSPESRLLLNVLNIDVAAVPEFANAPEAQRLFSSEDFQGRLQACRAASLVDYAGVTALKVQILQLVFEWCTSSGVPNHWDKFLVFRREQGLAFEQSCTYEALRQHFARVDKTMADWHCWPPQYRDPQSPAVDRFSKEHAQEVTFHAWMQWLADTQLAAAAVAAQHMEVGLYRDLAVGTDRTYGFGGACSSRPSSSRSCTSGSATASRRCHPPCRTPAAPTRSRARRWGRGAASSPAWPRASSMS